jgi:hypothetical protein
VNEGGHSSVCRPVFSSPTPVCEGGILPVLLLLPVRGNLTVLAPSRVASVPFNCEAVTVAIPQGEAANVWIDLELGWQEQHRMGQFE